MTCVMFGEIDWNWGRWRMWCRRCKSCMLPRWSKKNIENVNYLFDVNEVDVEDVGDANDGGYAMQMRKKCKLAPSPQQISNSNTAGAHALGKWNLRMTFVHHLSLRLLRKQNAHPNLGTDIFFSFGFPKSSCKGLLCSSHINRARVYAACAECDRENIWHYFPQTVPHDDWGRPVAWNPISLEPGNSMK